MRNLIRQFDKYLDAKPWPVLTGPFVVSAYEKNVMKKHTNILAGHASAYSRDGPTIFHMRDGPPSILGPPGGTGPPDIYKSGTGPPKTTGPPMEWLVRKKSLKKTEYKF